MRRQRTPMPHRDSCIPTALTTLVLALAVPMNARAEDGPIAAEQPETGHRERYETAVKAFVARHCIACHGPSVQKGDFRIDELPADFAEEDVRETWRAVQERVMAGTMPPPKRPRPDQAETAV